jgi:quinate dehydrogenase
LDHYDDLVKILGACNVVYLTPEGALHGINTDWAGICDAILANSPDHVHGRTAMVYGAGGASRAAIYALWTNLKFSRIYLINRDDQEVKELLEDIHLQGDSYQPELQHVRTVLEARQLPPPSCIVTTVPDYEAVTPGEIEARDILVQFPQRDNSAKELVLDMCYHL